MRLGFLILVLAGCAAPARVTAPPSRELAAELEPGEPEAEAPGLVDLDFAEADLKSVVEAIGAQAGRRIRVGRELQERVTIALAACPWMDALRVVAQLTRCQVFEDADGLLLWRPPCSVVLDFTGANLRDLLPLLAAYVGQELTIDPGIEGTVSWRFQKTAFAAPDEVPLSQTEFEEALRALAWPNEVVRKKGVWLVRKAKELR